MQIEMLKTDLITRQLPDFKNKFTIKTNMKLRLDLYLSETYNPKPNRINHSRPLQT